MGAILSSPFVFSPLFSAPLLTPLTPLIPSTPFGTSFFFQDTEKEISTAYSLFSNVHPYSSLFCISHCQYIHIGQ